MFLNFLSISAPGNILILLSLIIQYVPVILAPSKPTGMTVACKENCARRRERLLSCKLQRSFRNVTEARKCRRRIKAYTSHSIEVRNILCKEFSWSCMNLAHSYAAHEYNGVGALCLKLLRNTTISIMGKETSCVWTWWTCYTTLLTTLVTTEVFSFFASP